MRLSSTGSFGSNDRPICPRCGAAMHLIRRGPHPTFGQSWERQNSRLLEVSSRGRAECGHRREATRSLKRLCNRQQPLN
jgi:hypothetical protein